MKKTKNLLVVSATAVALAMSAVGFSLLQDNVSVTAETTKRPIALGETAYVTKYARQNNWTENGSLEADFTGVRMNVATGLQDTYNSSTTGYYTYAATHMGLGSIDLTNVTNFTLNVRGITSGNTRVRWFLTDADGTTMRYQNAGWTYYPFDAGSTGLGTSTSISYVWQGAAVDSRSGILTGTKDGFAVYDNDYYTGSDTTFDWTKVASFSADILTFDAITIDVGNLSATINGIETTLFDFSTATEASTVDVKANEWFFGPTAEALKRENTTKAGLAALGTTGTKVTQDYNEIVYKDNGGSDLWGRLVKDYEGETLDFTGYNGIVFDLNTTGAQNTTQVTFRLMQNGTEYKAYGANDSAMLVKENGEVSYTAANSADRYPAGFKGKFFLPFTAFNNLSALNNITGLRMITTASSFETGDVIKFSNVQVVSDIDAQMGAYEAALAVKQQIASLPTAEVTLDTYVATSAEVKAVRVAYDALSEDVAYVVSNYETLENVEENVADFEAKFDEAIGLTETTYKGQGATIRLKTSDTNVNNNGIRFSILMEKSVYEKAVAAGAEFGTVLLPTAMLDGELTVDTTYAVSKTTTELEEVVIENVTYMRAIVCLTDIPDSDYATAITARGYIRVGNSYFYSTTVSRSIQQVAIMAYEDPENEAVKDKLTVYLPEGYLSDKE